MCFYEHQSDKADYLYCCKCINLFRFLASKTLYICPVFNNVIGFAYTLYAYTQFVFKPFNIVLTKTAFILIKIQ